MKEIDSLDRILFRVVILLIGIPLWVNILIPDEPLEKQPWLPRKDPRMESYTPSKRLKSNRKEELYRYDFYQNQHTSKWEEFIEEIEQRGLDPWDPEAKEIWSTYYH